VPPPQPADQTEQKEEEQPWIEVKRKQKPKSVLQDVPKRGKGRPRKHIRPPKDKIIQFKTNNINALIKTDQEKWDACLIKTGPSSNVMDAYGLPKQQHGVQLPDWVYKRCKYLKSLSVAERNFILTGDKTFAFDPVPSTVIYECFTYADIVRGPAPVIKPPQAFPNPVQIVPPPVQVIKPPQVV